MAIAMEKDQTQIHTELNLLTRDEHSQSLIQHYIKRKTERIKCNDIRLNAEV